MSNEATIEALEPCKFCDGQDTFVERADFSSCYVVCNSCGARGPTSCNENEGDCAAEDRGMEPGENAARRLWNTRASARDTARLEAEVAMLRQLLHDVRLEATETIPPDGKEAAFDALGQIARMITARAALSERPTHNEQEGGA